MNSTYPRQSKGYCICPSCSSCKPWSRKSSFFGIGGGVPVLVAVLGMGMSRAAPTSQFALLFISFAGMISHTVLGHAGFYEAVLLSVGAFAGGLFGSKLSSRVKQKNLRIILSLLVGAAAVRLLVEVLPGWF